MGSVNHGHLSPKVTKGCILTIISDMKLYLILLVTLVCLAISTKADEGDTDFQMETNRKTKNSDNCKGVGEKCSKDPNKKCCDNLECNLEPLCCRANMPACYACKKKAGTCQPKPN